MDIHYEHEHIVTENLLEDARAEITRLTTLLEDRGLPTTERAVSMTALKLIADTAAALKLISDTADTLETLAEAMQRCGEGLRSKQLSAIAEQLRSELNTLEAKP